VFFCWSMFSLVFYVFSMLRVYELVYRELYSVIWVYGRKYECGVFHCWDFRVYKRGKMSVIWIVFVWDVLYNGYVKVSIVWGGRENICWWYRLCGNFLFLWILRVVVECEYSVWCVEKMCCVPLSVWVERYVIWELSVRWV
jgi:hypothetical protein